MFYRVLSPHRTGKPQKTIVGCWRSLTFDPDSFWLYASPSSSTNPISLLFSSSNPLVINVILDVALMPAWGFFASLGPKPLEHTCTEIRRQELKALSSWDRGEAMERLTARWQRWTRNDPLACLGFARVLSNWKTVRTEFLWHKSEFSHKTADLCLAAVPSGDHMVTARGCGGRRMLQENPRRRSIRQCWIPDLALKDRGWDTSPWQQGRGPAPRDRLIREEVESGGWTKEGGAWRCVQRSMAVRNVSVNLMFQHASSHVRSQPQNQFDVSCRELIASSVSRVYDLLAGLWTSEKKKKSHLLPCSNASCMLK